MKKTLKVSKALAAATGVAVFGSIIACGAALLAMKEGFKTAGTIVKKAVDAETVGSAETETSAETEECAGTMDYVEAENCKINNSETSCEQNENNQEL